MRRTHLKDMYFKQGTFIGGVGKRERNTNGWGTASQGLQKHGELVEGPKDEVHIFREEPGLS